VFKHGIIPSVKLLGNKEKVMEYIPAISMAVFMIVLFLAIWLRVDPKNIKTISSPSVLLLTAGSLFCVILLMHLFKEQTWTSDILKLLIGVLTGAAASTVANKTNQESQQNNVQTAVGNDIKQAGRDIIEEVKGDIKDLKNSVVNQYQSIQQNIESKDGLTRKNSFSFEFIANDNLKAELEEIMNVDRDSYPSNWIEKCVNDPEIKNSITNEVKILQSKGWNPRDLVLDNINYGIYVRFECEKIYEIDA
jgi:hypothetical protein